MLFPPSESLIEVIGASVHDNGSQGTNGSQDSDEHACDKDRPGRPEVGASYAWLLHHEVYQGRSVDSVARMSSEPSCMHMCIARNSPALIMMDVCGSHLLQ